MRYSLFWDVPPRGLVINFHTTLRNIPDEHSAEYLHRTEQIASGGNPLDFSLV
jgi:hypothetical protein